MNVSRYLDDLRSGLWGAAREIDWLPECIAAIPWKSHLSPHFLLHTYCEVPADMVVDQAFLDVLEQMHAELTAFLSLSPHTKHERISLETTFACFIVQTNATRQFGSILSSNVLFYLLNPAVNRLDARFQITRFRHELTHLLWGQAYGEAPPLFFEGLAEYAAYQGAADELATPVKARMTEVPPLTDVVLADDYWKHGGWSDRYRASGAWVQYLVERWGWDTLKALFLLTDYDDTQIQEHFAQVYGQQLETVEADWRSSMMTIR